MYSPQAQPIGNSSFLHEATKGHCVLPSLSRNKAIIWKLFGFWRLSEPSSLGKAPRKWYLNRVPHSNLMQRLKERSKDGLLIIYKQDWTTQYLKRLRIYQNFNYSVIQTTGKQSFRLQEYYRPYRHHNCKVKSKGHSNRFQTDVQSVKHFLKIF